ncbi:MAG: HIT family protein [Bacteroidales bacterium]|nr:HIT family protein [Bacteroidales bacterium]MCF8327189.1 HIT family protein [Bacteroidales bacterium]
MSSLFTKIVKGEIPSYKIAEDDNYLAFLDINPLAEGHTLVIPKKEVDYIFDLDQETYKGLFAFAQKVAKAMDKAIDCKRIGITVIGLEVAHAHVHLIPINTLYDMDFKQPKLKFTDEEFQAIAERIGKYVE